jgi:hypothetical protein
VGPVHDHRHDVTLGRAIRAEFVGNDPLGCYALFLQQSPGSLGISSALDDLIENVTDLINGTPKPVFSASDRNHNVVQMPNVLARRPPATALLCVCRPEFPPRSPDRFISDDDPAFEQQFLDQTQAQRKPEIEPDCMGDDRRRKTMVLIADGRRGHDDQLS